MIVDGHNMLPGDVVIKLGLYSNVRLETVKHRYTIIATQQMFGSYIVLEHSGRVSRVGVAGEMKYEVIRCC